MTAFRWTPWEDTKFKQCGVNIAQLEDFSFEQEQSEYLQTLEEIKLGKERKLELDQPVTEKERTMLRAVLGGMQWLVGQTRVDVMVDVNLLQSQVSTATVATLLEANKALRKLRQRSDLKIITRYIDGEIHFVGWSDASWANRKCGSSTGGYLMEHAAKMSWMVNQAMSVWCLGQPINSKE